MLTVEYLLDHKESIEETVHLIKEEDLTYLVSLLSEKEDGIRYQAFLILQKRSELFDDVYHFWDTFAEKLFSENSYQRSIGIMLLAENLKWDQQDRFAKIAELYLSHCRDERPITSRQTIQSIHRWIEQKPQYRELVKKTLLQIDINRVKDTMRKSILLDIISVLAAIHKIERSDEITDYLVKAMTGGVLDKKSARQLEKLI